MTQAGETPTMRAIPVDGVWWSVTVQEHRPTVAGDQVPVVTSVWFTAGLVTRLAYASLPARQVLEWPERELRALFDRSVPATAG